MVCQGKARYPTGDCGIKGTGDKYCIAATNSSRNIAFWVFLYSLQLIISGYFMVCIVYSNAEEISRRLGTKVVELLKAVPDGEEGGKRRFVAGNIKIIE